MYVDNSSPDGLGTGWADPRSDLQDGIDQAESLRASFSLPEAEVWVRISAAPYKPTDDVLGNASPSDPRDRTFTIPPGIQVKGGFVGTETTDDERIVTNARFTVLSGDIANTPSDPTDDSYSVVLVPDSAAEVVRISYLDNCLVVHGNANGSGSLIGQDERSSGGGLYAVGTATEVRVVTFGGCTATSFGGGASFKGSGEKAIGVGLTRCTFNANSATRGGGLSLRTLGNIVDPVFTNTSWVYGCSFRFNTAADNEATGDLGNGGAVWLGLRDSRLNFANCVMSENVASNEGRAIFVTTESPIAVPPSPLRLHSSTIVRNRISGSNENPTGAGGYAVYYEAPSSGLSVLGPELIKNSIVYGNVDGVNQPFQVGPASVLPDVAFLTRQAA